MDILLGYYRGEEIKTKNAPPGDYLRGHKSFIDAPAEWTEVRHRDQFIAIGISPDDVFIGPLPDPDNYPAEF